MKDRTPEHLKCPAGYCEAVYQLENKDLVIIGKDAPYSDEVLFHMHQASLTGELVTAIVVSPEMIADIMKEYLDEKQAVAASL